MVNTVDTLARNIIAVQNTMLLSIIVPPLQRGDYSGVHPLHLCSTILREEIHAGHAEPGKTAFSAVPRNIVEKKEYRSTTVARARIESKKQGKKRTMFIHVFLLYQ